MEEELTKEELEKKQKAEKEKQKKKLKNAIKTLVIKIIFIIIMIYVMFFLIFGLTRMSDLSMKPTINSGCLVLYYRLDKDYHVGDVVTFKKDGKRYVSRIVATQNQTLSLNVQGDFMTNEANEQHQTYFDNYIPENSPIKYPYKVGSNQVFVAGDYRLETDDSREFGAIDVSLIDGKVISFLQTRDI